MNAINLFLLRIYTYIGNNKARIEKENRSSEIWVKHTVHLLGALQIYVQAFATNIGRSQHQKKNVPPTVDLWCENVFFWSK